MQRDYTQDTDKWAKLLKLQFDVAHTLPVGTSATCTRAELPNLVRGIPTESKSLGRSQRASKYDKLPLRSGT